MNIENYISSGIIESYVLGLCTKEEEQELETLRAQYLELDTAIQKFEGELENDFLQKAAPPPPSVDEKVMQAINTLSSPVIHTIPVHTPVKKINNYRWLKMAAAAAVLLLLISSVFNYSLYRKNKKLASVASKINTSPTLPPEDFSVLTNRAITPVALRGVGIHAICRCTLFWDKKTGKAYVMIHHLVTTPDSKDYQLWGMVDGKPVSIGILNDKIRDRFVEMPNVPPNTTVFSVTLEKAGGSDQPDMKEEYLRGTI